MNNCVCLGRLGSDNAICFLSDPSASRSLLQIEWQNDFDSSEPWVETARVTGTQNLLSEIVYADIHGHQSRVSLAWQSAKLSLRSEIFPSNPRSALAVPISNYLSIEHATITLRGSAAWIEGRLHIWLGTSGSGKSTTAHTFVASNESALLVADDHLLLEACDGSLFVQAAPWDKVAAAQTRHDVLDVVVYSLSPTHETTTIETRHVLLAMLEHTVGFGLTRQWTDSITGWYNALNTQLLSSEGHDD